MENNVGEESYQFELNNCGNNIFFPDLGGGKSLICSNSIKKFTCLGCNTGVFIFRSLDLQLLYHGAKHSYRIDSEENQPTIRTKYPPLQITLDHTGEYLGILCEDEVLIYSLTFSNGKNQTLEKCELFREFDGDFGQFEFSKVNSFCLIGESRLYFYDDISAKFGKKRVVDDFSVHGFAFSPSRNENIVAFATNLGHVILYDLDNSQILDDHPIEFSREDSTPSKVDRMKFIDIKADENQLFLIIHSPEVMVYKYRRYGSGNNPKKKYLCTNSLVFNKLSSAHRHGFPHSVFLPSWNAILFAGYTCASVVIVHCNFDEWTFEAFDFDKFFENSSKDGDKELIYRCRGMYFDPLFLCPTMTSSSFYPSVNLLCKIDGYDSTSIVTSVTIRMIRGEKYLPYQVENDRDEYEKNIRRLWERVLLSHKNGGSYRFSRTDSGMMKISHDSISFENEPNKRLSTSPSFLSAVKTFKDDDEEDDSQTPEKKRLRTKKKKKVKKVVFCMTCKLELTRGKNRKKCSVCKIVYYCSRECQAMDWKKHKRICKKSKL